MRRLLSILSLLFAVVVLAQPVVGQVQLGPHAALNLNGIRLLVGGQIRVPVALELAGAPVYFRPSFDVYPFVDPRKGSGATDASLTVFNADASVPVDVSESFDGYLGIGLFFARRSESFDQAGTNTDWDGGLNIIVGAVLGQSGSTFRPFAEGILAVGDLSSGLIARGGILVSIGRERY